MATRIDKDGEKVAFTAGKTAVSIAAKEAQEFGELHFQSLQIEGNVLRISFVLVDEKTGDAAKEPVSLEIGNLAKGDAAVFKAFEKLVDAAADLLT